MMMMMIMMMTTIVFVVSSMRTIEDKLQNREEVVSRRRMLEAMLACMEKLDLAEEVVLFANQAAQANGATGNNNNNNNDYDCLLIDFLFFPFTANPFPNPCPRPYLICPVLCCYRTFTVRGGRRWFRWFVVWFWGRQSSETERPLAFVCSVPRCERVCVD